MVSIDRRMELADRAWQQGKLLDTHITRRWAPALRAIKHHDEQCCAYVNFFENDQGQSRVLVYQWRTPEDAAKAIREHNEALDQQFREIRTLGHERGLSFREASHLYFFGTPTPKDTL